MGRQRPLWTEKKVQVSPLILSSAALLLHLRSKSALLYGVMGGQSLRTGVGVEGGIVQGLDNLLDGRLCPVPIVKPLGCQAIHLVALEGFTEHSRSRLERVGGRAYIFQFPPTKNLRAMLGD